MKNNFNFTEVEENLKKYISSLDEQNLNFNPSSLGVNENGKEIELGFLCYAIKIMLTIKDQNIKENTFVQDVVNKIKSYQVLDKTQFNSYFIDKKYQQAYRQKNFYTLFKNIIKFFLKKIKFSDINPNKKFEEFIRAETKQSISTIMEFGVEPIITFDQYPKDEAQVTNFINNLDWRFPWNAGAQVAGLCVFASFDENVKDISRYVDNYLSKFVQSDGSYYEGKLENQSEKINGAMKVITGLDWLQIPIHKPKDLIDLCLSHNPNSEGCDIVDVIYVLYKCLQQSDYKKSEIKDYVEKLIPKIMSHYKEEEGGFSYYQNKSQEFYYGVKITNGLNEADIHGTTLLTWALSMIFSILGEPYPKWNIIKP
tara:strand:- start:7882 stop:8985 length:1104 start_codon:yes stop_codon:yes gene_type:complete